MHRLEPDFPTDLATLFVPLANGVRWVQRDGRVPDGGTVVVQGPGAHGLGCLIAAREAGARVIVTGVSGLDDARLAAARAFGAMTVEADRADVVAAVREATDGRMADLVVDLVPGAPETVETALQIARKGGTIVLVASKHGRPVAGFLNDAVVRQELTVRGVRGRDYQSVEAALDIIRSRRYPLERLRTHRLGLDEVDRALRIVGERIDAAAIHAAIFP